MATRKRTKKPVPARSAPTPRGVAASKNVSPLITQKGLGAALQVDSSRYLRGLIREIPDFPKPGISFKDMTPLLADPRGVGLATDAMSSRFIGEKLDAVVAIESRGFIFGALVAERLNLAFVPVRKPGKLPAETDAVRYSLEYGEAELQIHVDALKRGDRVLVVDDLLATGGTAAAAAELVQRRGAVVSAFVFLVELTGLSGRRALDPTPVYSLIQYE